MPHTRNGIRRVGAILATAAALLMSGCAVTDVQGETSAGGYAPYLPEVRSDDAGLREDFEATPQESHDFWSDPEKLEDAEGMEFQSPDNSLPPGPGDPATGAYLPASATMPSDPTGYGTVATAEVFDRNGLGASTFGRLYFTFDGQMLNVCSATIVNSDSGSIVVTAAHCVVTTDGTGTVAQSVIFVPGDRNDAQEQPHGMWAATSVSVPQQFVDGAITDDQGYLQSDEGWNYDFAFLKMEEKDGQTIQEVAGAQGIAFGVPVDTLTQIGYPSAGEFDGREEYMCASTSFTSNWQGGYTHDCNMTQGASGGGWLSDYDQETGTGYVVGVTSTISTGIPDTNSPVLGQTALNLYNELDGA
ncbi:MAG: trypsin-like serine peptidase [Gulosibacter sp.]|uniref:trypsin-like serine peptidase n=1 Tax=Gulosibacter sp. TaxID=2817531 RepID=UPI003F8DCB9C